MGKNRSERQNSRASLTVGRHFYGRRKGHSLRDTQVARIKTLLPDLRIALDKPARPQAWFAPQLFQKIALEIGFGGGEHLSAMACAHPEIGFIGCEPFINGIAKLLRTIDMAQLSNIRIYDDVAEHLLECLPFASLDQIFLLYPDPWHKRRHHKRRFINAPRVEQFFTCLKPGGTLLIVSDNDDYIAWCLMHFKAHGGFDWTVKSPEAWLTVPSGWKRTRYQARAERLGKLSTYLHFIRRSVLRRDFL